MSRRWKGHPIRDLQTYHHGRAVRHPDCDYAGDIDVHLTICAGDGRPFRDSTVAKTVCESVELYCGKLGYRLYGCCLMPDHLHVLLSPANSARPIRDWLREFKSYTTNRFQKLTAGRGRWQRSAYDHVCRDDETAESVLAYIIENPVRAGLVKRWEQWPWTRAFIDV